MHSSPAVDAALARSFDRTLIDEARSALPRASDLPLHPPYERVLLAVIGLADGDLEALGRYTEAARRDWRDVLYWWETPHLARMDRQDAEELARRAEGARSDENDSKE